VKLASGIVFVSVAAAWPAGTSTVTETAQVAPAAIVAPVIVNVPVPAPL
jgi:hypothetical protein